MTATHTGCLNSVDRAIHDLLSTATSPLIDCWEIGVELPERFLTASGLVEVLRARSTDRSTTAALWTETARRAQVQPQPWVLLAVAGMLPRLRASAYRVREQAGCERDDIESMVMLGFVETLRSCDPAMRNLSQHLGRSAEQRARYSVTTFELPWGDIPEPGPAGIRLLPLCGPAGHPDMVLARLAGDGVVTALQADIIAATRLDGLPLSFVADKLGLSLHECGLHRTRGEGAIAHALRSEN
ncbi:helix-turn-helix domain-containing protein [Actinokineospora spheciospongiae]|uniref:hypothetical protein n=1 Tax=Actinokineospora spheciospongiae TaxID=909613 RepID=UPI000D9EB011|nr:hypothetical protein [Actinokineospora spheciospongiae]PWW58357.1 hypothetical protein DFQ13_109150 [Actinokineospora spheciospongiae]